VLGFRTIVVEGVPQVNMAQLQLEIDPLHFTIGGFKDFLFSPRNPGEMIQFDENIFQMGWFNHPL